MFSKLIPNFVTAGAGPRERRNQAVASLPPTFRSAVHKVQPAKKPTVPPSVKTAYSEIEVRPGVRFTAADGRAYRVDGDGALRREVSNRGARERQPSRGALKERSCQAERLEAKLAKEEAARSRKRAARIVAAARRSQERAVALQTAVRERAHGDADGR